MNNDMDSPNFIIHNNIEQNPNLFINNYKIIRLAIIMLIVGKAIIK